MKNYLLLFLFISTSFSFKVMPHKFYLSVTEIEYKQEEKQLQIVSKVFIDDFQAVLEKRYEEQVQLSAEAESKNSDKLIKIYLASKFHISADGKSVQLHYLGKKYDKDQLVLFLEAEELSSFSQLKITNAILIDLFEDQKNVINVKARGELKSLMLRKDADTDVVAF